MRCTESPFFQQVLKTVVKTTAHPSHFLTRCIALDIASAGAWTNERAHTRFIGLSRRLEEPPVDHELKSL